MFSEHLEHVGKQGDARAEEDEPNCVEGMCLLAIVGQMEIDHNQPDQADRDVEEKDDAPVEIADDQTAGDGSEHGSDEGGDGDEAHGAEEIGFGEGPDEGEAAYGHHHGAAASLQDGAGNEEVDVARYAA